MSMNEIDDPNAAVGRRSLLKAGVAAAVAGGSARGASRGMDSAITPLKARVRGRVAAAGEAGFDEDRAAWNLAFEQRPLVTVLAAGEEDIAAAVSFAREQKLGIAVQATGHGATRPANGGVVINTSRLRAVRIDPAARTATTAAGVVWSDVLPKAHAHGLAPLSGSSSGVGVAGYTSGGGSGWLGRRYGFAADSVVAARVVTADGRVVRADAGHHPDLFWALRGGTSNFGIVTQLEFKLYPVSHVYGGGIYWPVERAPEVVEAYRDLTAHAPETLTTRLVLLQLPPLPVIPEPLRGRRLIAVQGAFAGAEAEGARLFAPLRRIAGALEDAVSMIPMTAADSIARDPHDPTPALLHTELLDEVSPELVRYLAGEAIRPGAQVVSIEMRHQGGAFARAPETPSAVGVRPRGFWFNAIAAAMPPKGRAGAEAELTALRRNLRPWVTGSVFLNGIDEFGADRVRAAYAPETWRRLAEVKRRYDPDNLFRFNRNIPPVEA
jgi:FAD/FMN-containing dehydrogenase